LSEPLIKDVLIDKSMITNICRDTFPLIKGEMAEPKGDFFSKPSLADWPNSPPGPLS